MSFVVVGNGVLGFAAETTSFPSNVLHYNGKEWKPAHFRTRRDAVNAVRRTRAFGHREWPHQTNYTQRLRVVNVGDPR